MANGNANQAVADDEWEYHPAQKAATDDGWDYSPAAKAAPAKAENLPGATPRLLEAAGGLPSAQPTEFEKQRAGLTQNIQEEGYRNAFAKENQPGKLVLSDFDVASAGLGAMGVGKTIARKGITAAVKPLVKGAIGATGGSFAGSHGGRAIGSIVGHPEEGAQIGATVGGLAGGIYGGLGKEPILEKGPYVPASQSPGAYRGPSSVPKPISEPLVVPAAQSPGPYRGPSSVEPPLGSPENPGLHSKMPTRMPKPAVTPLSESPNLPRHQVNATEQKPVSITEDPYWNQKKGDYAEGGARPRESILGSEVAQKAPVSIFPEPRDPMPGDRPGAMWSVGRESILPESAGRGAPGAGDVLRNIGKPIIYTPREGIGYPGPRSITEGGSATTAPEPPPSITAPSTYKQSEKAATMSAKPRDLGPEWSAGELQHEIQRNKAIIRNPRATAEELAIAKDRLRDVQAMVRPKQ